MTGGPTLHAARFADLDAATLYALLRLRVSVFVVEQHCPYPELDGRDTEPATRHLWLTGDPATPPLAYLRLLAEPDGTARIGRVCTDPVARGQGLARQLVLAALAAADPAPCVLDAQRHLIGFYAGLGFEPAGEPFVDYGIAHLPMRTTAGRPPGRPGRGGGR